MTTYILFALIIFLLIAIIFLIVKSNKTKESDLQLSINKAWEKIGLEKKINSVELYAKEIKDSYKSFEDLLKVSATRAPFGELSLETILADQLPPDMFGMRKEVLKGKNPDAHIKSTSGIICIDSKFALDNYSKYVKADNEVEKENYKKTFLKDIRGHLEKISKDYVCPEDGSAEFAFAYIPSEAVYYFLITEAYDLIREYSKKGVQLVSPLTLTQKIELIKAGVQARKLSKDAENVKNQLLTISKDFKSIDELWKIFYDTHLKNLDAKAEEIDENYKKIRHDFNKIS